MRAQLQVQNILQACEAYRDSSANPERGKYPSHLAELANPSFGGNSFLRNGMSDLIDPWGNPFEYVVQKQDTGETEVRVWTIRAENGNRKVIGVKRLANGNIEMFKAEK